MSTRAIYLSTCIACPTYYPLPSNSVHGLPPYIGCCTSEDTVLPEAGPATLTTKPITSSVAAYVHKDALKVWLPKY